MKKKKNSYQKKTPLEKEKHDIFTQNMGNNEKTVLQNLPREENALSDHLHTIYKLWWCSIQVHKKTARALDRGKDKNKGETCERIP